VTDLLWGNHSTGSRGPKPALSLDQIARAAVSIADRDGLHAVSMQRVAVDLGFTKMALYRYLPGKNDLVALMVEHALGGPPDLRGMSWRPGLRAWAHALLAAHLRHPWTVEAVPLPRPLGPHELSWTEAALALLLDTGLSGTERLDSVVILIGHIRVIAQQARAGNGSEEKVIAAIGDVLAVHGDRFPALTRTLAEGRTAEGRTAEGRTAEGRDAAFDFGLDRILDGLHTLMRRRHRAARRPPAAG
jgi:AcrR family transcriptional regulator